MDLPAQSHRLKIRHDRADLVLLWAEEDTAVNRTRISATKINEPVV